MGNRLLLLTASLAGLALAGCVVPADDYAYSPYGGRQYAYDSTYGRPYYAYPTRPPAQWNYHDNSWAASRWDSSPYDRYNRYRYGWDRPDP